MITPRQVAAQLVLGVEGVTIEDRLGQAHGHRRVVGPLTGFEAERTSADHVGDRLERPRALELERRADRVAYGESD